MTAVAFPKPTRREPPLKPGQHRRKYMKQGGRIEPKSAKLTARDNNPRQAALRSLDCIVPSTVPGATRCWYVYVKDKKTGKRIRRTDSAHVDPTGNEKGTGLKSPGDHTVPNCRRHNGEWSDGSGTFKNWKKERRREQARVWLAIVDPLFVPGDDAQHAADLTALGLGRWQEDERGGRAWVPGPVTP